MRRVALALPRGVVVDVVAAVPEEYNTDRVDRWNARHPDMGVSLVAAARWAAEAAVTMAGAWCPPDAVADIARAAHSWAISGREVVGAWRDVVLPAPPARRAWGKFAPLPGRRYIAVD
jgi:hypothetical protein